MASIPDHIKPLLDKDLGATFAHSHNGPAPKTKEQVTRFEQSGEHQFGPPVPQAEGQTVEGMSARGFIGIYKKAGEPAPAI